MTVKHSPQRVLRRCTTPPRDLRSQLAFEKWPRESGNQSGFRVLDEGVAGGRREVIVPVRQNFGDCLRKVERDGHKTLCPSRPFHTSQLIDADVYYTRDLSKFSSETGVSCSWYPSHQAKGELENGRNREKKRHTLMAGIILFLPCTVHDSETLTEGAEISTGMWCQMGSGRGGWR